MQLQTLYSAKASSLPFALAEGRTATASVAWRMKVKIEQHIGSRAISFPGYLPY
jgi:hypothetical protein